MEAGRGRGGGLEEFTTLHVNYFVHTLHRNVTLITTANINGRRKKDFRVVTSQGYGMVTAIHNSLYVQTGKDNGIAHAAHQNGTRFHKNMASSIFALLCQAFIGIVFVIMVVVVFAKLHSSGIKIFTKVLKRLVINRSIQTNGILRLYHHQRQRKYIRLGNV